jgi:serine/threonine protein kinase
VSFRTPPRVIGSFQLERCIGQGAHASVWLAHHRSLPDYAVAIKIHPHTNTSHDELFLREAQWLSRFPHAHMPQLYDYGTSADFDYIVMQYVAGTTLRQLLTDKRHLSLTQVRTLARQIATVIDHIHAQHLIHRDINPSNIIIAHDDGAAFLVDFGVAYHTRDNDQHHRQIRVGTPGYIAPEQQLAYTAPTYLVDIFSFGVMLYEACVGTRPWPSQPQESIPSITQHDVVGIPPGLDTVFAKLLAYDPTQRYSSADQAVTDIELILQPHIDETHVEVVSTVSPVRSTHAVETALSKDIDHAVLHECIHHCSQQQQSTTITAALNAWGKQSPLRTQLLGRRVVIAQTQSQHVYCYELHLVQETRFPPQRVRVSPLDEHFTPDAEVSTSEYWQIDISDAAQTQRATSGSTVIPGSRRVEVCSHCQHGMMTCPTCAGLTQLPQTNQNNTTSQQRICHTCHGQGRLTCRECLGNGEIRFQEVMQWQRQHVTLTSQDAVAYADPTWIQTHCQPRTLYRMTSDRAGRAEWELIAPIAQLMQQAEHYHGSAHRVVSTEVVIRVLPVTEFMFEAGTHDTWQWPWQHPPSPRDPLYHRWALIGFENLLPPNRHWLNWTFIIICILAGLCTILLMALIVL